MSGRRSARDRILDAAERVALSRGPTHATLESVAAEARVSKGGLLYHFPSQPALLEGLLTRFLERMDARRERCRAGLPDGPHRNWLSYVLAYLGLGPRERRSAAALLATVTREPALMEKVRQRWRAAWDDVMRGDETGRAAVLLLAVQGMWLSQLMGMAALSSDEERRIRREILRLAEAWSDGAVRSGTGGDNRPRSGGEPPLNPRQKKESRRKIGSLISAFAAFAFLSAAPMIRAENRIWASALAESSATDHTAPLVSGPISARAAVEWALQCNTDLKAVRRELTAAAGRIREARGALLPDVVGGGGYQRVDEAPSLELGGRSLTLGTEDSYSADLTLRQPIYRGGAIIAGLRAARRSAEAAEAEVRAAEQQVIHQALKGYFDTWLATTLEGVQREALAFAEATREDVARRRAQGVASDYDVLRADVEVARARALWIRRRNDLDIARAQWIRTLGLSPESDIRPSDEPSFEPVSLEESALLERARRNRPDLQRADLMVQAQEEAVRIARGSLAPGVSVFATQRWSRPDPHSAALDRWGDAWSAGVSVEWSFLDGGERRGRIDQEKARLEQARWRRRAAEELVALEVRQAWTGVRNAAELVTSQALNRERAREGLRMVREGYQQGVQSALAVLDAQTALTQAQADHQSALHAYTVARLALEKALGTLGPDTADTIVKPRDGGR